MTCFFIKPLTLRPDFRLVITFLWSDLHNVDTEGNSSNPASQEWTELYVMNRENEHEVFNVDPVAEQPLTLRICSDLHELAARVAYFLATETQSQVAVSEAGPWHDPEWLNDQVGDFDLAEATRRADRSRWRRATIENPYPES